MTSRRQRIEAIERNLGGRKLVWVGTRGTDARPLLELRSLTHCFSLIAPLGSGMLEGEVCLEAETGHRVDLDGYDIDKDTSPEARAFRLHVRADLRSPSYIVAYRPLSFLTTLQYPNEGVINYLGMFYERVRPFEHKVWVETELRKRGIRTVPWSYYSGSDTVRLREALRLGPLVVRANLSSGGTGLLLTRTPDEVDRFAARDPDGFFAASPYLEGAIPLNVNACVFRGGQVSLHGPSVQLIGVPELTSRYFGYCGNDFTRIRELDAATLMELEQEVAEAGRWLSSMGYWGAFGLDALVHDGRVMVSEINARFQGSSEISALLDSELDRSDVYLEHMAAHLGLTPLPGWSLSDIAEQQSGVAQLIFHNRGERATFGSASMWRVPEGANVELQPGPGVCVDQGAIVCRIVAKESVTQDGRHLRQPWRDALEHFARGLTREDRPHSARATD